MVEARSSRVSFEVGEEGVVEEEDFLPVSVPQRDIVHGRIIRRIEIESLGRRRQGQTVHQKSYARAAG